MEDTSFGAGTRTRVMIADDQLLLAEAVARILEDSGKYAFTIVADFQTAVEKLRNGCADIALLDSSLPGFQGIESLKLALTSADDTKVILLGGRIEPPLVKAALEAGAHGIIEKEMPVQALSAALDLIQAGQIFAPARVPENGHRRAKGKDLSDIELSVLRKTAEGYKNKEIAEELVLPETSIKMHLRTINRKLGSRNRAHAVTVGRELGLI